MKTQVSNLSHYCAPEITCSIHPGVPHVPEVYCQNLSRIVISCPTNYFHQLTGTKHICTYMNEICFISTARHGYILKRIWQALASNLISLAISPAAMSKLVHQSLWPILESCSAITIVCANAPCNFLAHNSYQVSNNSLQLAGLYFISNQDKLALHVS